MLDVVLDESLLVKPIHPSVRINLILIKLTNFHPSLIIFKMPAREWASSILVPDVNPVGVRVADGEVALEGERHDHEDGCCHKDLTNTEVCRAPPSKTLSGM